VGITLRTQRTQLKDAKTNALELFRNKKRPPKESLVTVTSTRPTIVVGSYEPQNYAKGQLVESDFRIPFTDIHFKYELLSSESNVL
jgi:hypothetical protein